MLICSVYRAKQYQALTSDLDVKRRELAFIEEHISPLLLEKANVVVADEGHEIKNPHTARARALMRIKTQKRIALTGYPLQNKLMEYYTMMQWTQKGLLDPESEFKEDYVAPITAGTFLLLSPICPFSRP